MTKKKGHLVEKVFGEREAFLVQLYSWGFCQKVLGKKVFFWRKGSYPVTEKSSREKKYFLEKRQLSCDRKVFCGVGIGDHLASVLVRRTGQPPDGELIDTKSQEKEETLFSKHNLRFSIMHC